MHKLLVFDLDGTLTLPGEGISTESMEYLNKLEELGYKLAISSGKSNYYLSGFCRASHFYDMILVGENGAVYSFGTALPPKERYVYPYDKKLNKVLSTIYNSIKEKYPDMFFQPNEVMVTPFPSCEEQFEGIQEILDNIDTTGLDIYRHWDTFDIIPSGVNKGNSIDYLCKLLNITNKDVITFGDASNDISMFNRSDISISIGDKVKEYTTLNFNTIEEALKYVLDNKL